MSPPCEQSPDGTSAWIPWLWHPAQDRLSFIDCPRAALRAATFLDQRFDIRSWPREERAFPASAPATRAAWLLHSSLCGSTFLSRVLSVPGYACALREPWTLRQLADWRRGLLPGGEAPQARAAARRTGVLLQLLNRACPPGERLIIKPTNLANILLLDRAPNAPADPVLILTGTLTEFLAAVLRREESLRKMPALGRNLALTRQEHFPSSLSQHLYTALFRPAANDCLLAAAGVWLLHQCEFEALARRGAPAQTALVTTAAMLADPLEVAQAAARHLGAPIPEAILRPHLEQHRHRHAKFPRLVPYDIRAQRRQTQTLLHTHAAEIRRVRTEVDRWLAQGAAPVSPPPLIGPPLTPGDLLT